MRGPRPSSLLAITTAFLLAGCQTAIVQDESSASPLQEADPLAQSYTQLGLGYMREGQYELAWRRLHRALEIAPGYSAAHNSMAVLYEQLKQPSKADEHYRRAVALNPNDSSAQTNYGTFLCRQGNIEEAEQRFQQALKNSLYATPEIAHANAGVCMHGAGQSEKAERYLRSALEINPRIASALYAMSELNLQGGKPLPARAYFQRYLEVGEQTPAVLWLGVQIERALGDRRAADTYALRLRSQFPDSQQTGKLLESEAQ